MLTYNTYMYKSAAGGERIYNQSYARNAVIDTEQQANDTRSVEQPEFSEDWNSRKLQMKQFQRRYHLWRGNSAVMRRRRSHQKPISKLNPKMGARREANVFAMGIEANTQTNLGARRPDSGSSRIYFLQAQTRSVSCRRCCAFALTLRRTCMRDACESMREACESPHAAHGRRTTLYRASACVCM